MFRLRHAHTHTLSLLSTLSCAHSRRCPRCMHVVDTPSFKHCLQLLLGIACCDTVIMCFAGAIAAHMEHARRPATCPSLIGHMRKQPDGRLCHATSHRSAVHRSACTLTEQQEPMVEISVIPQACRTSTPMLHSTNLFCRACHLTELNMFVQSAYSRQISACSIADAAHFQLLVQKHVHTQY